MSEDSSPYGIALTSAARRDLSRLAPKFADPVLRFLEGPLRENPHRVTKPLGAELTGQYAARVGPAYRVVVEIDDVARVVTVHRIMHRSDVYRPR